MPNLYNIAGCNGAGKTTASYTVLPEILNCREFVNADNIAAGLSPFNAESVAVEAGRLMLQRVDYLLNQQIDFAIETTLSTRSYVSLVKRAQEMGYEVTLLYFWLNSPEMAISRVAKSVSRGGHHIPTEVVIRRYYRGIKNLISLYISICDRWMVNNNVELPSVTIAEGIKKLGEIIFDPEIWETILNQSKHE